MQIVRNVGNEMPAFARIVCGPVLSVNTYCRDMLFADSFYCNNPLRANAFSDNKPSLQSVTLLMDVI